MEDLTLEKALHFIQEKGIEYIPKILIAVLILWVGFKLVTRLAKFLDTAFKNVFDESLRPFLISMIRFIANAALVVFAAAIVGFDVAGLLGVFAAAAFAIGMALQGSLGNFASGILILTLKPYKVGQWVQIDNKFGVVEEIGVFSTTLETPGKKTLIIPNSKVTDNIVTNFSKKGMVRLEIDVKMPYNESFPKVKTIIEEALKTVDNILEEPKTVIGIENFDSHSIDLTVRPFVEPEHFWQVTYDTRQAIKNAFFGNKIQIAYSEGVQMGDIGE